MTRKPAGQTPPLPAALVAAVVATTFLFLPHCSPERDTEPAPVSELLSSRPRLMVLIVIDQARADYITRFRPVFRAGLDRLLEEGVYFTNANHDHANTVTGVGHATLATGSHPRRSGIVGNYWYDRELDERVYCVSDPEHRRSPRNLKVTGFGDWLKAQNPRSKVFSISAKDRAAITMGGFAADGVFWYSTSTGDWITSSYYEDDPSRWFGERDFSWVEDFNDLKLLDELFGTTWEQMPIDVPLEELGVGIIDEGVFQPTFPHYLGGIESAPDSNFYAALYDDTPMIDEYLARFAETIIDHNQLGTDDDVDFLGLGFSQLDLVGHRYGPNSPEVVDTMVRLDLILDRFLGYLDRRVGLEHTVIALASDHGIMDVPEYREMVGLEGGRADVDDIVCFQQVYHALRERFGDERWILRDFYLNWDAIEETGHSRSEVEQAIVEELGRCEHVARVWTGTELATQLADPQDVFHRRLANGYRPDRSPDIIVQFEPYHLARLDPGSTHGSVYNHDTWVPMLLRVPGVPGREVTDPVYTVDLAPTLAALLGIRAPADLDGVDRSGLLVAPTDEWGSGGADPRQD